MSFWGELKRRNVFRAGIAYLVASWLILQVVDVVVPILELPNWISRAILLLLAVGFIVALILAWAYELTPEGVRKEKDVDRLQSITPQTGRKLDFIIIGVLAVALAFFAYERFVLHEHDEAPAETTAAAKAIAVLPFLNMSADEDQEYFSDGLTEELLNLLVRIPDLRVTSRSSAFYYKGKDIRIADVGRELGVDHILEGSVRKSGDTIRITAQLIDVANDAHLWSDTWDRQFDDIFEIQDEIAAAVVSELQVRLTGAVPQAIDTDTEAYSLYLRARHLVVERTVESYTRALGLLQAALEIDPDYIPALLEMGDIYWDGRGMGMFTSEDPGSLARNAANRVLEIDSDNALAHLLLAQEAASLETDIAKAHREVSLALALAPHDIRIVRSAAFTARRMGNEEEARRLYERAKTLDPVSVESWYENGLIAMAVGQWDEAEAAFRKAIQLAPEGVGNHQRLAWTLLVRGRYDEALEAADKEIVPARRASVRALIYQAMGETEKARIEHEKLIDFGERWTYEIARMYAFRDMHDEAFEWIERAFARADSSLWFVSWDPFLDNIRDDPRFPSVEERLYINRE